MNNMLHNEIIKIIQIALSENQNSPLNDAILKDSNLLTFISEEVSEDQQIKTGTSVYKSRKGYIAHIINLCIKLKELALKNSNIKSLVDSTTCIIQVRNSQISTITSHKNKSSIPRNHSLDILSKRTSSMGSCLKGKYHIFLFRI